MDIRRPGRSCEGRSAPSYESLIRCASRAVRQYSNLRHYQGWPLRVQVRKPFRPVGTSSAPFLYHVCPDGQLFPQRPRANLGRNLKYETALNFAKLPSAPHAAARRSRVAGHGSRTTSPSSRITNHPPPPTNHTLPNRYPIIRNPSNLLTTNEKTFSNRYNFQLFGARSTPRRSPITTHKSRVTNHDSRYNRAFLRAVGQSNDQPARAAGRRRPARHETGFGLRSSNVAALILRH
jgi:hypothetical protein